MASGIPVRGGVAALGVTRKAEGLDMRHSSHVTE